MTLAAIQQAQNAYRGGKYQRREWAKDLSATATVALSGYHTFGAAGQPGVGSYTGGAALAAQQITGGSSPSITGGYFNFSDPSGSDQSFLTYGQANSFTAASGGQLILCDLLVLYQGFNANINTAQNTTGSAAGTSIIPSREDGTSLIMFLDVQVALGATPSNVTVTYTRKDLTSGRATPAQAMTVSAAAIRIPHAQYFLALQNGDIDVVSVQTVQLSAAMGAGTFALWLARPLASIAINTVNTPGEARFLAGDARNVRIKTGAALSWIFIPSAANANWKIGGSMETGQWDPAA